MPDAAHLLKQAQADADELRRWLPLLKGLLQARALMLMHSAISSQRRMLPNLQEAAQVALALAGSHLRQAIPQLNPHPDLQVADDAPARRLVEDAILAWEETDYELAAGLAWAAAARMECGGGS